MKPHKHAELIKAWADGAKIQYRAIPGYGEWKDPIQNGLMWIEEAEYRIKPEPKPDEVRFYNHCYVYHGDMERVARSKAEYGDVLKLTFDGETGELKSAEVLK